MVWIVAGFVLASGGCTGQPSTDPAPSQTSLVAEEEGEVGGVPMDWASSPLVDVKEPASPSELAEVRTRRGFADLSSLLPAAVYSDGTSIAYVMAKPPAWVIQTPLEPEALPGLDADQYPGAAAAGTKVSNADIDPNHRGLLVSGRGSVTLLFELNGTLIQVSVPPDRPSDDVLRLATAVIAASR